MSLSSRNVVLRSSLVDYCSISTKYSVSLESGKILRPEPSSVFL
jgi:hypothetical protein